MKDKTNSLIVIPGLGSAEITVVESLLQAAKIQYIRLPGDHAWVGRRLLIQEEDLEKVKELLGDFRIHTPMDDHIPIPW